MRHAVFDGGVLPANSVPPTAAAAREPGSRVGAYRIVRKLATGGMGDVYEGVDVRTGVKVAIKILRRELFDSESLRARFVREGEVLARVRHPNVVRMLDIGADHGDTFLVMEMLEGEDVLSFLRREGKLVPSAAVDLLLPVIGAIATAHAHGVIHRDLTPQNVFLVRRKRGRVVPKVLDFGIAKVIDRELVDGLTHAYAILGTAPYMAPEQMRGATNANETSDQYALGAILYRSLTGRVPFPGGSVVELLDHMLAGPPAPPSHLSPNVPPSLDTVVLRALASRPETRFDSAVDLGIALLDFASPKVRARYARVFSRGRASQRPPSAGDTESLAPRELDGVPRPRRTGCSPFTVGLLLLVLGTTAAAALWRSWYPTALEHLMRPLPASDYAVTVTTTPASARIALDGEPVAIGRYEITLHRDGIIHTLDVSAPGYEPLHVSFLDTAPPATIALEPLPGRASSDTRATRDLPP